MARPSVIQIVSGEQGWDADVSDNLRALTKTSFPVPNGTFELYNGTTEGTAYTTTGQLPSAAANEGCLAAVDAAGGWQLFYSNGASWQRVPTQATDPGNSTATNVSELLADYNELLTNLRASGVIG